jgi:hypothetical protein
MSSPGPVTRSGAQRDAQRELSKAIYHRDDEPLPVRAVHAFGRVVDHFLDKAFAGGISGSGGALALVILVAVIVIVVIWRVGVPRTAAASAGVLPPGRQVSAADHRALSGHAADSGDWHTAVVERMRAVARELEERSVLDPRAGRTATELAGEAGQRLPLAADELHAAAQTFNDVAYGGIEATGADLDVVIAADSAVCGSTRSKVLAS